MGNLPCVYLGTNHDIDCNCVMTDNEAGAYGAALPRIHLTTVSQHKFQQSRIAVERLLEKINGSSELTADQLEPELIIRSTCAKRSSYI